MTPAQLKGSIIQAAIQGKLVEQLLSDSDVDEAISSMTQERERLIQEGKLKKEGKINKTADTEIEIPSTWRLVPLRELVCKRVDNRGKTPPHSQMKNPNECIDLLEIASIIPGKSIDHSKVEKYVTEETYNLQRGFVKKDDILIATVGSIGKFALMDDTKSAVAQNIIAIKCFDLVDQHYIFYLLQSPYFYSAMGCIKMEAVQASIKVPDLMNLNVPLPPIEEQHRIVAKIEELLPFVERYAEAYEKLEQFNAKFPEDMKKSILQYAIQGKLVEQRLEEGNAEDLYKQILTEKQKLIKEGKIKKDKLFAEITEEEIPFDIPESWKWVRLGQIINFQGGYAFKSAAYVHSSKNQVIRLGNVKNNNLLIHEKEVFVDDELAKIASDYKLMENDILVSMTGTRRKKDYFFTLIVRKEDLKERNLYLNQRVGCFRAMTGVDVEYLLAVLQNEAIKNIILLKETGTANQGNLGSEDMKEFVYIPLPPLNEQHRIVAKLKELLPYCDRLVN